MRALELLVRQCRTTARPGIDPPARYLALNHAKILTSRAGELQVVGVASHQKLPSAGAHLATSPDAPAQGSARRNGLCEERGHEERGQRVSVLFLCPLTRIIFKKDLEFSLGLPRTAKGTHSRLQAKAMAGLAHPYKLPNGRPRRRDSRSRLTSASVCGSLTCCSQPSGRGTAPKSSLGLGRASSSGTEAALDPSQSWARSTRLARTGMRSMYRKTDRRWSSSSIGKLLNRPCPTCPLEWQRRT